MLGRHGDEKLGLVLHTTKQCSVEWYPLFTDMDHLDHRSALLPRAVRASSEDSRLSECEFEAAQCVLEILLRLHDCLEQDTVAGPKTCPGTLDGECHVALGMAARLWLLIDGPSGM